MDVLKINDDDDDDEPDIVTRSIATKNAIQSQILYKINKVQCLIGKTFQTLEYKQTAI